MDNIGDSNIYIERQIIKYSQINCDHMKAKIDWCQDIIFIFNWLEIYKILNKKLFLLSYCVKEVKLYDFKVIAPTRVQWLALCQPRSQILEQQWVLKSVKHSIIAHICEPLAKTFTDLCSEMFWVFAVTGNVM